MGNMIKDLFANLSILSFFILLGGYLLRDTDIYANKLTIKKKLIIGVSTGILGVLFMVYTIRIFEGAPFLDLRFLALMLAFYIGGLEATVLSGLIIGSVRLFYYETNTAAIAAVVMMTLFIISYWIINKLVAINSRYKWVIMHIASIAIATPIQYFLLKDYKLVNAVLIIYVIISSISSVIVFILLEYVRSMNLAYSQLKTTSTIDFLTGLNNVRYFDNAYKETKENALRYRQKVGCIVLDIDYFKKVNDTYGHSSGDLILKQVADILKNSISDKAILARTGGEEFCILFPNSHEEYCYQIGERIRNRIKKSKFTIDNGSKINITISLGLAMYNGKSQNFDMLIKNADKALYDAKGQGRDRVCVYKEILAKVK